MSEDLKQRMRLVLSLCLAIVTVIIFESSRSCKVSSGDMLSKNPFAGAQEEGVTEVVGGSLEKLAQEAINTLTMDVLLSEFVIDHAVERVAEYFDPKVREEYGTDWGIAYIAVRQTLDTVLEQRLGVIDTDVDFGSHVQHKVLEIARQELRDPQELEERYKQSKQLVLDAVVRHELVSQIKPMLMQLHLWLSGSVDAEKLTAMRQWSHQYRYRVPLCHECGSEFVNAQFHELDTIMHFGEKHGLSHSDRLSFEFTNRRRVEGGDLLVQKWAEIVEDFYNSL